MLRALLRRRLLPQRLHLPPHTPTLTSVTCFAQLPSRFLQTFGQLSATFHPGASQLPLNYPLTSTQPSPNNNKIISSFTRFLRHRLPGPRPWRRRGAARARSGCSLGARRCSLLAAPPPLRAPSALRSPPLCSPRAPRKYKRKEKRRCHDSVRKKAVLKTVVPSNRCISTGVRDIGTGQCKAGVGDSAADLRSGRRPPLPPL